MADKADSGINLPSSRLQDLSGYFSGYKTSPVTSPNTRPLWLQGPSGYKTSPVTGPLRLQDLSGYKTSPVTGPLRLQDPSGYRAPPDTRLFRLFLQIQDLSSYRTCSVTSQDTLPLTAAPLSLDNRPSRTRTSPDTGLDQVLEGRHLATEIARR